MPDWTSLTYVVVDVEGNGQQPPDLVELAAVPIIDGSIGEPSSWMVKPDRPITHFARRLHGITDDHVQGAPAFDHVADEVRTVLDVSVLIAHNAHVDVGVLQRKLQDWQCPEVLDTLTLARRLLPGQSSYKLGSLVKTFGLAEGLNDDLRPHRATYDALVTAKLFVHIATGRTLDELRDPAPGGDDDAEPTLF